MALGIFSDRRPVYVRLLFLILGEALAGVILYALFTFMSFAVQMVVATASWAVIANANCFPLKNKSLGSLLSGLTALPAVFCFVEWRISHEDLWSRLMLVGCCLMAALIFLDRRQDA